MSREDMESEATDLQEVELRLERQSGTWSPERLVSSDL